MVDAVSDGLGVDEGVLHALEFETESGVLLLKGRDGGGGGVELRAGVMRV